MHLLSTDCRADRPKVTLPPRKRLGIAFGPRYEVGESSSAATARPAIGLRADYGFVSTMDRDIRRDLERDVGYGITESWDEIVEAWQGDTVVTDCGIVMPLHTHVVAQQAVITELQDSNPTRRQAMITEMFRNHGGKKQFIEALKLLKRLQTQMIEFERQQGPTKGPTQSDAPEEAGSSS
ncbi:hypothetical protein Tco_0281134 [Tanacetum coccineum]